MILYFYSHTFFLVQKLSSKKIYIQKKTEESSLHRFYFLPSHKFILFFSDYFRPCFQRQYILRTVLGVKGLKYWHYTRLEDDKIT